MLKRFVMGYFLIGLLMSVWINAADAMSGRDSAFNWSSTVTESALHFVVAFGGPLLAWPVIASKELLELAGDLYTSITRALRF